MFRQPSSQYVCNAICVDGVDELMDINTVSPRHTRYYEKYHIIKSIGGSQQLADNLYSGLEVSIR